MARNVEIKARLQDIGAQRRIAGSLAKTPATILHQVDTFFVVPSGRLKLRTFGDGSGELISYRRADQSGPKSSDYQIYRTASPAGLRVTLEHALGIRGVVTKTRELYLVGRTRVHLDQVESLGDFLELEVVLESGEDVHVGQQEAQQLMDALRVTPQDLIQTAYIDMLEQRAGEET